MLLVLVTALVSVNVYYWGGGSSSSSGPAVLAGNGGAVSTARIPSGRLEVERLEASERVSVGDITRNVFEFGQPVRVATPKTTAVTIPPTQTAPPPPPPEPKPPLRFFGFAERSGSGAQRALLTDGESIFVASEGDVVLKDYRVLRIQAENVELEDTVRGRRWVIPREQP